MFLVNAQPYLVAQKNVLVTTQRMRRFQYACTIGAVISADVEGERAEH